MNNIPKEPHMLCSFVNLKLRDEYSSLEDLCSSLDISSKELINTLKLAGYEYVEGLNQFR